MLYWANTSGGGSGPSIRTEELKAVNVVGGADGGDGGDCPRVRLVRGRLGTSLRGIWGRLRICLGKQTQGPVSRFLLNSYLFLLDLQLVSKALNLCFRFRKPTACRFTASSEVHIPGRPLLHSSEEIFWAQAHHGRNRL